MAYDSSRHVTVMFGGLLGSDGYLGDTWEYDGAEWQRRVVPGPNARFGHAMCYDSVRQRVVLFGGRSAAGMRRDTWEWDGQTWRFRSNLGPAWRIRHAMAYNSVTQRAVLFGGSAYNPFFGDTWEWDGTTWTQIPISGPSARYGSAIVYDNLNNRMLLFGGAGNEDGQPDPFFSNELWQLQGGAWSLLSSGFPAGRYDPAMAFDAERGSLVLFGGSFFHPRWELFCDTWEWRAGQWIRGADSGPSDRAGAAMVYRTDVRRSFMFGGFGWGGNLQDGWEWAGPAVPLITTRPTVMSVNVGEELVIGVTVLGDSPLFTWDKDTVALEDGGRVSGATTAALRVLPAAMGDQGYYRIVASNGCASTDAIMHVTVVCRADFDLNGLVQVQDLLAFLSVWFAHGAGADFDGDGTIAVTDIFAFQTAWFAGCP